MIEKNHKGWKSFRSYLFDYASQDRSRRSMLLFRGHARADWRLETTLDRFRRFSNNEERDRYARELVDAFRRESLGLELPRNLDGEALDLLARHPGVVTPILDWSQSPYVAAYFAFSGARPGRGNRVAIWNLDKQRPEFETEAIQLIDSPVLIFGNRRAISQRGVFTRITNVDRSIEEELGDSLTKLTLPASARDHALADLDEMMINAGTLFGDLDGVASAVMSRYSSV